MLLIVPYGIETNQSTKIPATDWLLIVPYGIETKWEGGFVNDPDAFNRTLWN